MSNSVIRKDGEITHVWIFGYTFLTKRDHAKWIEYEITVGDLEAFFGEDDMWEEMKKVANGEYPHDNIRYDVMSYNEVFDDPSVNDNEF